jgi:cyclopropane-fatty-acyl-phospholipid synthase
VPVLSAIRCYRSRFRLLPSTWWERYIDAVAAPDVIAALHRRYESFFATRPEVPFAVAPTGAPAHLFGTGDPLFTITVRDPRGAKALATLDQFAVAVAYLQGWLDVDGDLAAALKMRRFFRDVHPVAFLARLTPATLLHGRHEDDRRAIARHYDEDSAFFLTFLDRRHRCYTEGVFARDDEPLEEAMTRKMDLALDAIGVEPGDRVLEVGGGWGAFAEHAARRGIEVTTTTLSVESERFLTELFTTEGLPVRVVRQHIFGFTAERPYDAIVNMGVTEHLPDYRTTLRKYAELLRPGGTVYLDALAMRRKHGASTFMKRYIYPGNSAPLLLHQYLRHVAHSPFELLSVDNDRHNYFLTCREWARRLDAARDEIVQRWGEPLYRRFRLFLWGSAAGFDTGLVQAYRWVLRLP